MSILPFFYKSTGRGWFPGAKFKAAPREMRSTIARDVLFPWKMRQEIAETKLASVSYANRRKHSVSNGGRESLSRWTSIRNVREKKIEKLLAKAARRDETTGSDEGQCQVLEIPRNGWQPRASWKPWRVNFSFFQIILSF